MSFQKFVVAIGNFDGVHKGHKALFEEARARGAALYLPTMALSFTPHPAAMLGREVRLLTEDEEKTELIAQTGLIDFIELLPFTEEVRALSPEVFFDRILVEKLHAAALVVGENFRFGAGGAGDAALLRTLGEARDIPVSVIPMVTEGGAPISSSRIRALIDQGYTQEATELLGHGLSIMNS